MNNVELTCIRCPMGCALNVTLEDKEVIEVTGNTCKRGVDYANHEITSPTRMLTTTIVVKNGVSNTVPVKSITELPKDRILSCVSTLSNFTVSAPIAVGDILVKNIDNTGVDIVASSPVLAK